MEHAKKKSMPATALSVYQDRKIVLGEYSGMPSIAARQTSIEYGDIQLDVGYCPREIGMNKLLILVTHFHSDHGSDICNCVGHRDNGERVTVFVPAYCAQDLFNKIKSDISMQKGRSYTDDEIVKMARIIGCKRKNDTDSVLGSSITSQHIADLVIAELVDVGDKVNVKLRDNKEVVIEPFSCYHTVDTCGYVIYDLKKKLSDCIRLNRGTSIDVNFTEDQTVVRSRSKTQNTKSIDKSSDKFKDIIEFSERHNVKITVEIIDEIKPKNFILKVRRLTFPDGLNITTKKDAECILLPSDFVFLKKYKINIHTDVLTPKTMFFGDTCSYVFHKSSEGYQRVSELLESVETVIIESTYLESKTEMSEIKFKNRSENRHMFLFELCNLFKKYPGTEFILIHFSACYTIDTIKKYIKEVNKKYPNVKAFI